MVNQSRERQAKQLKSGTEIERQSNEQSLTPEKERVALLGEYLYKYAAIANRDLGEDGELIHIYAEALKDVDPRRLQAGLRKYLEEGDRFPWPSEIREASEL